jgi:hypothetical protein
MVSTWLSPSFWQNLMQYHCSSCFVIFAESNKCNACCVHTPTHMLAACDWHCLLAGKNPRKCMKVSSAFIPQHTSCASLVSAEKNHVGYFLNGPRMFTPPVFCCSVDRARYAYNFMLLTLTIWISILGVIPRSCAAEEVCSETESFSSSFTASSEVMTSRFQASTQVGMSQPSSPARSPQVYTSVAEMKRSKGKVCVDVCMYVPCLIRIIHLGIVRPIFVFNLTSDSCVLIVAKI